MNPPIPFRVYVDTNYAKAATVAQRARDEGVQGIIAQLLLVPVTCHPDHFPTSLFEYGSPKQMETVLEAPSEWLHYMWSEFAILWPICISAYHQPATRSHGF
jgi:hypothetical protein